MGKQRRQTNLQRIGDSVAVGLGHGLARVVLAARSHVVSRKQAKRSIAVLAVMCVLILGLVVAPGCKKKERSAPPAPPSPAGKKAEAEPAVEKEAETGREKPAAAGDKDEAEKAAKPDDAAKLEAKPAPDTDLSVEVDRGAEKVKVASKKTGADSALDDVLEEAFQKDKDTTSRVVKSWVTDNDILTTEDVRGLLEASWNQDPEETRQVIRPWFVEHMTLEITDIPALLSKAWNYDQGDTREILRTWGDQHGFVDVSDPDAMTRHNFVAADDIGQIRRAVREFHGNNWTKVAGVKIEKTSPTTSEAKPIVTASAAAPSAAEEIPVKVSWATPRRIGMNELRFSVEDNGRFKDKLDAMCTVTPRNKPDNGIALVIDTAVDLPGDWVQVHEADFVAIAAKFRNQPIPERNSPEWKKLLGLGIVPGSVYL